MASCSTDVFCTDKGLVIRSGRYVYIRGDTPRQRRWVAKVREIVIEEGKEMLKITWMYHLNHLPRKIAKSTSCNTYEIYNSIHHDEIEVECVMDLVEVQKGVQTGGHTDCLRWYRTWDHELGRLIG